MSGIQMLRAVRRRRVTAAVNLLPNPGAETNTTGWEVHGQCALARDTTAFRSGVASFKMSATGSDSAIRTALASKIPLAAGTSYTASAWVRDAATLRGTRVDIWWYDSANALISAANGTAVTPAALSTWTQFAATATAPANTTQGILVITNQASATSEVFNIDDVSLVAN